jgi:hypothetical protein
MRVGDREDRVEAGHGQDLPHRGARRGQLKLTAALARLAQAGKKHVHAGRIAEIHSRHVDDDPGRRGGTGDHRGELAL